MSFLHIVGVQRGVCGAEHRRRCDDEARYPPPLMSTCQSAVCCVPSAQIEWVRSVHALVFVPLHDSCSDLFYLSVEMLRSIVANVMKEAV